MKLFFRKQGEGIPIIILHGLFGCSDNWITVSKELSKKYTVYAIDQRNHGQSPHSENFSYDLMADDLFEFIEDHQLVNPILIGHSMGGKTVMRFACKYPEIKINKQVIVDIAPKYYPPHHQLIIDALEGIPLNKIKTRNEADQIMSGFITEFDIRQFLLKNLYRDSDHHFKWRMNLAVIESHIEEIGKQSDIELKSLTNTVFIKGAYSDYIIGGDEVLIRNIFPNSQVIIIEAGHWVQAEKPKEFIEVVEKFIN